MQVHVRYANQQREVSIPPCDRTQEDLIQRIAKGTRYGADAEEWAQDFHFTWDRVHFVCSVCRRPWDHHPTADGADAAPGAVAPVPPEWSYSPKAPISCDMSQHHLTGQFVGQFILKQHPVTGENVCATCWFPVKKHPNRAGQGDQVLAVFGMQHAPPPVLTADEEEYLRQRDALAQRLPLHAAPEECPYAQQDLEQFNVDSCYKRFQDVWGRFFTTKTEEVPPTGPNMPRQTKTITLCATCHEEEKFHPIDPRRPPRAEWAYTPRSHMPCAATTGQLENAVEGRGFAGGIMRAALITQHPHTGETLCNVCKYPIAAHVEGPDPALAAMAQTQNMMAAMVGPGLAGMMMGHAMGGAAAPRPQQQQQPGGAQQQQQQHHHVQMGLQGGGQRPVLIGSSDPNHTAYHPYGHPAGGPHHVKASFCPCTML